MNDELRARRIDYRLSQVRELVNKVAEFLRDS